MCRFLAIAPLALLTLLVGCMYPGAQYGMNASYDHAHQTATVGFTWGMAPANPVAEKNLEASSEHP